MSRKRKKLRVLAKGFCNICNSEKDLTWDHVPPQGSSTLRSVVMRSLFDDFMATARHPVRLTTVGEMEPPTPTGFRHSQNGVKFRTLCADCNNRLLGGLYDPELKKVSAAVTRLVNARYRANLELPCEVRVPVKTHKLVRGLVGHALAAHPSADQTKPLPGFDKGFFRDLRDYFLVTSLPIPPSLKIMYWPYPSHTQRIVPGLSLLKPKSDRVMLGVLMKFFPVAFYLVNSNLSTWELAVPRIQGNCCNDVKCEVDLIIDLKNVPPLDWPEIPTADHLTLMPMQPAVVANHHRSR
jgi:hypothetical protein